MFFAFFYPIIGLFFWLIHMLVLILFLVMILFVIKYFFRHWK